MRKITTHTGDKGYTNTLSARGVRKDDPAIVLMANIDHLNAILGGCPHSLRDTQQLLFSFMGCLSMLDSDISALQAQLQTKIDESAPFNGWNMPDASNYIPHMARTQCRIVETLIPPFMDMYGQEFETYALFFNTLSNYIFEEIQKLKQ